MIKEESRPLRGRKANWYGDIVSSFRASADQQRKVSRKSSYLRIDKDTVEKMCHFGHQRNPWQFRHVFLSLQREEHIFQLKNETQMVNLVSLLPELTVVVRYTR